MHPKLTNEQKRIKMAEACGWTDITHHKVHAGVSGLLGTHLAKDGVLSRDWLPDYLNDLNAMHEAEKILISRNLEGEYEGGLLNLVAGKPFDSYSHWSDVGSEFTVHATAAQRAEAFGLALGLWKEGE